MAQASALKRLQQVARQIGRRDARALDVLRDLDAVLPLLGSLYANATRRAQQGRFDVAALLLYRCLELISQQRLATYGILTEQPDLHTVQRQYSNLGQRYRGVETSMGFEPRGIPRRDSIALLTGYMLLAALDDPLVAQLDLRLVQQRVRSRNKSILAHGYRLITPEEYTAFSTVVETMLDRFFIISSQDRAEWEATYQFVQPFIS
jgi:CRISPR-associated protein (TIGR02710 family)